MARHLVLALVLFTAKSAMAQAVPAPAPTPNLAATSSTPVASSADLDALRAEVIRERDELRQELAALRARVDTQLKEQVADHRSFAQRLEQAREASQLVVRATRLALTINGFVQADAVAYRGTSKDEVDAAGETLNETRFLLRRARLRAMLQYRFLFGAFEIDANTNKGMQVRPQSFEVGVQYINPARPAIPYIALHMGIVRTPFGFEVQQSDKERLFLERSTIMGAMFPGEYDLGIRAFGGWRALRYVIAGLNGDPIGEKLFPARDPSKSKDLVVYVGADQMWQMLGVRGGFSAVYGQGFHKGASAIPTSVGWKDANMDGVLDPSEVVGIVAVSQQPSSTFQRYAVGGDAGVTVKLPRVGKLVVMGELIYGVNMDRNVQVADPVAAGRDLHELGGYIGVTQELTPWAQAGIRYDRYEPDMEAKNTTSGQRLDTIPYSQVVATVAGRVPGYGRLILEYGHVIKPTGRAADQSPTSVTDNVLTLRGEVVF